MLQKGQYHCKNNPLFHAKNDYRGGSDKREREFVGLGTLNSGEAAIVDEFDTDEEDHSCEDGIW